MTDIIKQCDVVDSCEECPRYADDCDGDKRIETTDSISRADAINKIMMDEFNLLKPLHKAVVKEYIENVPSADAEFADLPDIPRAYYERIVGNMAHEINMLKEQLESDDAVQGEWKHTITWQPYCSNCEYVFGEDEEFSPFWKYCPMCGARMKGGGE